MPRALQVTQSPSHAARNCPRMQVPQHLLRNKADFEIKFTRDSLRQMNSPQVTLNQFYESSFLLGTAKNRNGIHLNDDATGHELRNQNQRNHRNIRLRPVAWFGLMHLTQAIKNINSDFNKCRMKCRPRDRHPDPISSTEIVQETTQQKHRIGRKANKQEMHNETAKRRNRKEGKYDAKRVIQQIKTK